MNIVILDSKTLGRDIDFTLFKRFGEVFIYPQTSANEVSERIEDCDVIIVNKLKLGAENLCCAKHLKLICVAATGFDNIDVDYCRKNNIAVCNVKGYSTDSVAQLTVSMALSLSMRLRYFDDYVKDGEYTAGGIENHLEPVFHELRGMTWGIVGFGAIGRRVADIAEILGCRVIAYKRVPVSDHECVSLEELCRRSDIISVHLPLSEDTRGILSRQMIGMMKPDAIVINVARGAVVDESALAEAIIKNRIGGIGIDVYSSEPMRADSPFTVLADKANVILTPHMAWGAYEARVRCMKEIESNIEAFINGETRNRVDRESC